MHHSSAMASCERLLPTSAITVNSPASCAIIARLSSTAIASEPFETSTWSIPSSRSHSRYSSTRPCSNAISSSVPPRLTAMSASRQIATLSRTPRLT